jgi:phosphatidylinositol alpha-1,6-mannosyltransferase
VEAVRDGVTGFLVPPDNAEALISVLRKLLGDPGLRRRMGVAGRRWVVEEMNWDRTAQQMIEILEQ